MEKHTIKIESLDNFRKSTTLEYNENNDNPKYLDMITKIIAGKAVVRFITGYANGNSWYDVDELSVAVDWYNRL